MITYKQLTFTDERFFEFNFQIIANELINNTILNIGPHSYRINEISFYYYSDNRPDFFSKKLNAQKANKGKFVIHNHKDKTDLVDLTFGTDDSFGGILIRNIYNINTKTSFDKPAKVTRVFKNNSNGNISDPFNPHSTIHFQKLSTSLEKKYVISSPRYFAKNVLHADVNIEELKWLFCNFNFSCGKPNFGEEWNLLNIISQYLKDDYLALRDMSLDHEKDVKLAIDCFKRGITNKDIKSLLSIETHTKKSLAELYGAWWAQFYLK